MTFKVTRRDILTAAGGGVVGIMLTPAPWKLVDDVAIWTQNWKWIPRPPKGPETLQATACALCPRGCAAEARCIGGLPVAMRGAGGGALCALGLTAHHLPYHPARLLSPVRVAAGSRAATPASVDSIVIAIAGAMRAAAANDRNVAVLDMRPGRSISWAWRALLGAMPHGTVVGAPGREGSSLDALARLADGGAAGIDFAVPKTILSFGAPFADRWGSDEAFRRILDREVRLIQVEPTRSDTAALASRWIPCRPGGEALLALAIANVLINESLVDVEPLRTLEGFETWRARVAAAAPHSVAAATGVAPETIVAAARELAADGPALVLAGEQPGGGRLDARTESAVLSLNALLGAFDSGAIVNRADLPLPVDGAALAPVDELERLEDGSLALLVIDASAGDALLPWPLVERKLAREALVVALSPFLAGTAARATYVVPTPPFLEASFELPSPFDGPAATLAFSRAILPPRGGAIDPAALIRAIAEKANIELPGAWATSEELASHRVASILENARGTVVDRSGSRTPVAAFGSADELRDALLAGSRWIDAPGKPFNVLRSPFAEPRPVPGPGPGFSTSLTLLPVAARDIAQTAAVSPVLTKLYRESSLRLSAGTAILNPATARELDLRDGAEATLATGEGTIRAAIATDESVMPGVVALVVGPERSALGDREDGARRAPLRAIDICSIDADGVWRASAARIVEG